jgi:hypothetical protein
MGVPRYLLLVAAVAVAGAAAACAGSAAHPPAAAAHPYSGPLYVRGALAAHPRAGAAGNVVDCRTFGSGGFRTAAVYNSGATSDSPDGALEVGRSEGIFGAEHGLLVAKREADRVLYVVEVDGVAKQAVIVRNGPATEGAGGPGWYIESWASCDASEFSRADTDKLGLLIWTDSAGIAVPTTTIVSSRGPEHCDWQSMTFLQLGSAVYVREPKSELAAYFAGRYRAHATLPTTAVDTGYQRDGQRLWLSADKQVAYVGTATDVAAWPRTIKPLLCA